MNDCVGKEVDCWLGIPYAAPPMGDLRFRHPKPIERWEGIHEADKKPNSCWQNKDTTYPGFLGSEMWNPNTNLSEDCLYLSICVPKPRPRSLATMVWIYGGGFFAGTSTLDVYDPKILVSEYNIVFAAMQYRVASLGFLYLDTPEAPGNSGLYDQLMALTWISENIAAFGGNPKNITIFGESAGAVSVNFHLFSPLSRHLFQQAILESGSNTAPWAVLPKETALGRAAMLAEGMECPTNVQKPEEMVECLKRKDPGDLVLNEWNGVSGIVDFPFVPVVDGAIVDMSPLDAIRSRHFKKCNILIGSNEEEGSFWLLYYLPHKFQVQGLDRPPEHVQFNMSDYRQTLNDLFRGYPEIVIEAIAHEYTNFVETRDPDTILDNLEKVVGDLYFSCPVKDLADAYVQERGLDVYKYYFTHRAKGGPWPKWVGAYHGDEILYVFGVPLIRSDVYSKEDVELSRRMMQFWTNFAKTGTPNMAVPGGNWTRIYWPQHTLYRREFLDLNVEDPSKKGRGPRIRECAFWRQFLPQLLHATGYFRKMESNERTPLLQQTSRTVSINTRDADELRHQVIVGQEYGNERSGAIGIQNRKPQNKRGCLENRFLALFFMCFMGFGSYFCYDNPGALQGKIKDDMDINTSQFANLYAIYSWPNVVLCFVGGYLLDSVFGMRLGTVIFAAFVLLGQIVFAAGGLLDAYWLMMVGRFIFGVGGESLAVAQNMYAVSWFKGKELNMVFGLQLSFARVGSTVNFASMMYVYSYIHEYFKGPKCIGVVLMIAAVTCLLSLICATLLGWMDAHRNRQTAENGDAPAEVIHLKDVKDFPASFWLTSVIAVAYYVAIFPFIGLGQVFFERKYSLPPAKANLVNGIVYVIAAVASPFMGFLIDKTGRNVFWVFLSIVGSIGCHAALAFTFWNPLIPMVSLGFMYSLLASSLWPIVALVLPEHQLGTAYGLVQAVQNLGLAVITMVAGNIVDSKGYFVLETFFLTWLCISLVAIVLLWLIDFGQGGILNMSIAQRNQREQETMAAEALEREKLMASGSMADITPQDLLHREHLSEFSIRNRFLSRIGAHSIMMCERGAWCTTRCSGDTGVFIMAVKALMSVVGGSNGSGTVPPSAKKIKLHGGSSSPSFFSEDPKEQRRRLPIFSARQRLVEEVRRHESGIVIGETGSGKTTQVPQFLLEAGILGPGGAVAVTQPRRVGAVTLAKRVAAEMGIPLGTIVGYAVRFEAVVSPDTRIKFLTDGMLLRQAIQCPELSDYSVVILDEAHERSIHTDLLFGILKAAQRKRRGTPRPLKILVMSATMDVDRFSAYLDGAPVLYVQGREHPVQMLYTKTPIGDDDYAFASVATALQIHRDRPPGGDILVFLTGQEEIEAAAKTLREATKHASKEEGGGVKVCPLYAALPWLSQQEVLSRLAGPQRKIILSTNIAETSVTIPGVKYVVDSGRAKIRTFDPSTGLEVLQVTKISRAQAWQRSGRAGREGPGVAYRVYAESQYHALSEFPTPEIQRCNLRTILLELLAVGVQEPSSFDFLDKPSPKAVENGLKELQYLGAIERMADDGVRLTQTGRRLASFPLDPRFSKILLSASHLGCLEEAVSVVSLLSGESVFLASRSDQRGRERRDHPHGRFFAPEGDVVALLNAFRAYKSVKASKTWCYENELNWRTLSYATEVRKQLMQCCQRQNLQPSSCGKDLTPLRQSLASGLFMSSAELQPDGSYSTVSLTSVLVGSRQKVGIHPTSCLFGGKPSYVVYVELVHTSATYMRNLCVVEPSWLLQASPEFFHAHRFHSIRS
ncbi:unnamed protein product [Darwinula stevensoni]|uniref:Acetylcholinesterase n=1 Tax=Darwinula stevensoni TaxID=69355 RepID=A0A7R8X5T1_9CRUS|nr:unnamed protein product [Darwinula stevensoni]CAG0878892.1 unnamed protein product [Darwinula stevensoni]